MTTNNAPRIVLTYNHGHRAWMAVSNDLHQGSIGGPADMVLAQAREWMGVETSDERTHADIAYERACEQLKRDNQELRATVARLTRERDELRAEVTELRNALRQIANTHAAPEHVVRFAQAFTGEDDAMEHDHKDPE